MPTNNIQKSIEKNTPKLKKFLENFLNNKSLYFKDSGFFAADIDKKLKPFSVSGKLLRGNLVLLVAGNSAKDVYRCASALELCHSVFLVHDDVIDEDLLRRGKPSIHALYAEDFKGDVKLEKHYGISQAVCLGDIGFFLALHALADLEHVNANKIRKFFNEEIVRVGFGQMDDVYFGLSNFEPSVEDIMTMYRAKTARYSISLPIALGMYLKNEEEPLIKKCILIGEYLGVVFQMKDDELGIFGDVAETGKGVFKDIEQNKKTILRHLLLQSANSAEVKKMNSIFGAKKISKQDAEFILGMFEKYHVLKAHTEISDKLLSQVQKIMRTLPIEYQQIFEFIIDFNKNRIK